MSGGVTTDAAAATVASAGASDCEGGTLEIDFNTIAFVLTAFVGMVQYVVQQRIRRQDAIDEEERRFAAAELARLQPHRRVVGVEDLPLGDRVRVVRFAIDAEFGDLGGLTRVEVDPHDPQVVRERLALERAW